MKAIDKYFDGYVKAEVPKKNGKGTTTSYEYIDDFYHINMDAAALRIFKLETVIIFVIYTVVYFYASFMDTDASHTAYVGVFSLLILIPLMFWYDGLINFLTAKENMERRKFNFGIKRISHSTVGMLWLSAFQIAGEVLYMIIHRAEVNSFRTEALFIVLAAVEVFLLFFYKKELGKLEIVTVPNPLAEKYPKARKKMEEDREEKKRKEEEERKARAESNGYKDF